MHIRKWAQRPSILPVQKCISILKNGSCIVKQISTLTRLPHLLPTAQSIEIAGLLKVIKASLVELAVEMKSGCRRWFFGIKVLPEKYQTLRPLYSFITNVSHPS